MNRLYSYNMRWDGMFRASIVTFHFIYSDNHILNAILVQLFSAAATKKDFSRRFLFPLFMHNIYIRFRYVFTKSLCIQHCLHEFKMSHFVQKKKEFSLFSQSPMMEIHFVYTEHADFIWISLVKCVKLISTDFDTSYIQHN